MFIGINMITKSFSSYFLSSSRFPQIAEVKLKKSATLHRPTKVKYYAFVLLVKMKADFFDIFWEDLHQYFV